MNQEKLEQTLREKFKNFSSAYKADTSMWDTIESQLPQAPTNKKRFLFLIMGLGVVVSAFIFYSIVNDNQLDESITKQDVKLDNYSHNELTTASVMHHEESETDEQSIKVIEELSHDTSSANLESESLALDISGDEEFIDNLSGHISGKGLYAMKESTQVHTPSVSDPTLSEESKDEIVRLGVSVGMPLIKTISSRIEINRSHIVTDMITTYVDRSSQDHRNSISIGLVAGVSLLKSSYSLNDGAYQSVLTERQNAESPSIQYNFGLEAEYNISKSWSLLVGTNMSFFQDQFFLESNEVIVDSIQNYEMPSTSSTGNDTIIVGVALKNTTRNTKTWKYSDRLLLRIPIILSYNKSLGHKSKLGIGLGMEAVFYQSIKGTELDLNGEFYDLENDIENRYGMKGASALFRINYIYQITKKWDLRVIADYKKSLRSNYNISAPIQKSFDSLSFAVGSHFTF